MPWFDVALALFGALFGLWIAVNPDEYRRMGLEYSRPWVHQYLPDAGTVKTVGVVFAVGSGLLFILGFASHF